MASHPDQLALIQGFRLAVGSGELDTYYRRHWQKSQEYAGWLSENHLPELSVEQASTLYRASGGSRSADFKANSIAEVRDSLDFLLYDTIKLEGRFDECVSPEGAYKLVGAGKEFITYLLCLRNPTLFGVWNASGERALKKLSRYPETLRKGHWGLRYIDLLDSLQRVRLQMELADFREVDQFAYWIAKRWLGPASSTPDRVRRLDRQS